MYYTLPTRDECQTIIKDSDVFYCTETEVQGYKVEMYNYMLASAKDFTTPYHYEMRGITFIQDKNGNWVRFPALSKFFNISQCEGWHLDDVKDKKITNVQDKMDGCVDGDTLIKVKYKNEIIIEKISNVIDSKKFNEFEIMSYNLDNGTVEFSKIINVLKTTSDKKWIKLKFDTGFELTCTEDHRILTIEGWVEAKDLESDHILIQ